MKRFLLLLPVIWCFLFPSAVPVSASEGEYLRVIGEDVGFFASANETDLLFYLPHSYYVFAIRTQGEYTYCRYQDDADYYLPVYGYVKTALFSSSSTLPQNPYPKCTVDAVSTTVVYTDRGLTNGACYAFGGSDLRYYGKVTGYYGEVLYYVALGDTCGYVRASAVQPPDFPLHEDPLPSPEEPEIIPDDPQPTPDDKSDGEGLKIAMIVALGVICLIVVYLLFRPEKTARPQRYHEDDYE